jgi:solute carrier family 26 (sodium-independent sulfate anion transporter), member 11
MIALGLSNILGSMFQSFPNTGSFTRTAVNNASGVRTPIGGFYTGIFSFDVKINLEPT